MLAKIRCRCPDGCCSDNYNNKDHNIYDVATEVAQVLVIMECEFSYSYENCECVFTITGGPYSIQEVVNEFPKRVRYDLIFPPV